VRYVTIPYTDEGGARPYSTLWADGFIKSKLIIFSVNCAIRSLSGLRSVRVAVHILLPSRTLSSGLAPLAHARPNISAIDSWPSMFSQRCLARGQNLFKVRQ
jgi:hypothetical protein